MEADIEALRERFLNREFDARTYTVTPEQIVDFAVTTGELAPRYTDPGHPDFQAPPTFPSSFSAGRQLPPDFPRIGGLGMDAGKSVAPKKPIRPNVELTGRTHLHDIYAKTGRSGRMVFMVARTEFHDPDGELVAIADTSIVQRERPAS